MSLLRSDAKTYIARILSGATDSERLAQAQDALFAAIEEWNLRHDWSFRLMDTSGGFSVTGGSTNSGTNVLTSTVANAFVGVNIGTTVTDASGNIPAATTVTGITSATQITMSAVASGTTLLTNVFTFSGDIPVIAGTDTYRLPSPVKRPYSARLLSNGRNLEYKEQRLIDREYTNLAIGAEPAYYNLFNSTAFAPTSQNGKIRLFPIPAGANLLRVRYHSPIPEPSTDATTVEVLDRYIYALMELGRYYYLKELDAENPRTGETKERAEVLLRKCISDDREGTNDNDMTLVPFIEWGRHRQIDSTNVILDTWW